MTQSQKRRLQRKRTRQNYLAKLVVSNPESFDKRMRSMNESWAREIQYRAHHLRDENDKAVEAAYDVVEEALKILDGCGNAVAVRAKSATESCLNTAYTRSMAQAMGKPVYRMRHADTENL